MVVDLQIGLHNGDVDEFPLRRALTIRADAIKFQVTVVGFLEFIEDHLVHGPIVVGHNATTYRSKTLKSLFIRRNPEVRNSAEFRQRTTESPFTVLDTDAPSRKII